MRSAPDEPVQTLPIVRLLLCPKMELQCRQTILMQHNVWSVVQCDALITRLVVYCDISYTTSPVILY